MDKIKLVIWDLDETFWKGTLSEEGIEIIESNILLIKELTNRGIMNSIASKNDFNKVKKELIKLDIWQYFIFPKIEWLPKGQLVKEIIELAQLRAPNVLFLDDNHLNLEEVSFYNKGIHVQLPDFVNIISEHKAFKGKNDFEHSRLQQYKVLEKKSKEAKSFSNNDEFLKHSQIKIKFTDIVSDDLDRVHELVERTNQLNFTKFRSSKEELKLLLNKVNIQSQKIEVWDKFGEYGIVGFYALDTLKNKLVHFVFSCRTMNIGIEQFIYNKLNHPKLDIIGDISGTLEIDKEVDWIEEVHDDDIENKSKKNKSKENKINVLLKGGCDLGQMIHYLQYKNIRIETEFNDVNEKNIPLHKEHTVFAKNAYYQDFYQEHEKELNFIPFINDTFFKTSLYKNDFDIVVYSLLMDYTQEIYKSKISNCKVAYGGYGLNLIRDKNIVSESVSYLNNNFLDEFEKKYISSGQILPKEFEENLNFIISKIKKPIILINGAEIQPSCSIEKDSDKRHKIMNLIIDKLVEQHDNVYLLDMRKIVTSKTLLEDNIRHYTREVYIKMSEELISIIDSIVDIQSEKDIFKYNIGKLKHFLLKEIKIKLMKYLNNK